MRAHEAHGRLASARLRPWPSARTVPRCPPPSAVTTETIQADPKTSQEIQQVDDSGLLETLPPPAAILPAPPQPQPVQPTLRRLGRRLFTSGAWARAHAISAGLLQLYAFPCTLWLLWQATHSGRLTPSAAEIYAVIALSFVKDATAVPLALRHRRGVEREAMLIAAYVDFAVWAFTLYLCGPLLTQETGLAVPPLPDAARQAIFGAIALGGVVSTVRPIITATDLVAASKKTSVRTSATPAVPVATSAADKPAAAAPPGASADGDAATAGLFGLVQVIPGWSVIVGAGTVLFGGPEMRQWMVNVMPAGYGGFYGVAFCGAAAGSLGVFSATLYSRRMITAFQMSVINAVQISVYLGFLAALCVDSPDRYGEVMRVTQLHPFWLFNEQPWLP
eukprot:jgi/Ulvmu1/8616/UM046_0014.1